MIHLYYTIHYNTISQKNEFTEAYRSGPWLSGTLTVAWYWVGEHQAGPGRAHRPGRAISEYMWPSQSQASRDSNRYKKI